MITFHSRQSGDARRTRKNENAGTFNFMLQIALSICTVAFTKRENSDATIFTSRCSHTVLCNRFDRVEALPLNFVRFLRLAKISPKIARSPARRSRDGRETSGKKSGEIFRVMFAQRPGNGRTVATAMPLNVRQGDSPCAEFGRAMSAPKTDETTRNTAAPKSAQQPMKHLTSNSSDFSPSVLTVTSKNYEHTNYTNVRS
jgi:hypothetical protein